MSDYGSTGKAVSKGRKRLAVVALALLLAGGVAFLLWSNKDSRRRAIAESTAQVQVQAIIGPPCEPGTAAGKLGRGDQWMTFVFNEVEYGRRIGHADCGAVADSKDGLGFKAVCQFTSPAEIRVVTKAGATYFDVGLGQPATVTVSDAGISCIKGGNFRS